MVSSDLRKIVYSSSALSSVRPSRNTLRWHETYKKPKSSVIGVSTWIGLNEVQLKNTYRGKTQYRLHAFPGRRVSLRSCDNLSESFRGGHSQVQGCRAYRKPKSSKFPKEVSIERVEKDTVNRTGIRLNINSTLFRGIPLLLAPKTSY
jgi:hypothetical protein